MRASRRPLASWLVAEVCSLGGTRLSMVAVPWLVLTTTGSAALTGAVAMAEMLPYVLAKALGGPLIDRLGSRRIAVGCDLASMLVVGLIPVLHLTGRLSLPALITVVAVAGLLRGPSDAAKQAFVPALARHAQVQLERVTGLAGTVERLAGTVGAAAAGALAALVGPALALGVNAATFGVAAILIAVGLRSVDRDRPEKTSTAGYLTDLRVGWAGLRSDTLLVIIVVMVAGTNFLDQGFTAVFVPVWVREHGLGAETVGLIFAATMGFAVGGALLATAFGPRLPRLLIYTVGFLLCGPPRFGVMALDAPLTAVLAVMAIAGFASGFVNPILSAVTFERIPPHLVGRVSSLISSLCWSTIPFGALVAGLVVSGVDLDPAMVAFGIGYLLLTLLPVAAPTFRQMNTRPEPTETQLATYSPRSRDQD